MWKLNFWIGSGYQRTLSAGVLDKIIFSIPISLSYSISSSKPPQPKQRLISHRARTLRRRRPLPHPRRHRTPPSTRRTPTPTPQPTRKPTHIPLRLKHPRAIRPPTSHTLIPYARQIAVLLISRQRPIIAVPAVTLLAPLEPRDRILYLPALDLHESTVSDGSMGRTR